MLNRYQIVSELNTIIHLVKSGQEVQIQRPFKKTFQLIEKSRKVFKVWQKTNKVFEVWVNKNSRDGIRVNLWKVERLTNYCEN